MRAKQRSESDSGTAQALNYFARISQMIRRFICSVLFLLSVKALSIKLKDICARSCGKIQAKSHRERKFVDVVGNLDVDYASGSFCSSNAIPPLVVVVGGLWIIFDVFSHVRGHGRRTA